MGSAVSGRIPGVRMVTGRIRAATLAFDGESLGTLGLGKGDDADWFLRPV